MPFGDHIPLGFYLLRFQPSVPAGSPRSGDENLRFLYDSLACKVS